MSHLFIPISFIYLFLFFTVNGNPEAHLDGVHPAHVHVAVGDHEGPDRLLWSRAGAPEERCQEGEHLHLYINVHTPIET